MTPVRETDRTCKPRVRRKRRKTGCLRTCHSGLKVRLVNHLEATPCADAVKNEASVKRQTVLCKHFSHQLHLRLRERTPALTQPISDDLLAQLGSEGGDFEEERLRAVGAESVEDVVLVRQS